MADERRTKSEEDQQSRTKQQANKGAIKIIKLTDQQIFIYFWYLYDLWMNTSWCVKCNVDTKLNCDDSIFFI